MGAFSFFWSPRRATGTKFSSLTELSTIAINYRNGGLMSGNEARNWVDLPPRDGLDELVMLENFVPVARLGDQKKLNAPIKEDTENV